MKEMDLFDLFDFGLIPDAKPAEEKKVQETEQLVNEGFLNPAQIGEVPWSEEMVEVAMDTKAIDGELHGDPKDDSLEESKESEEAEDETEETDTASGTEESDEELCNDHPQDTLPEDSEEPGEEKVEHEESKEEQDTEKVLNFPGTAEEKKAEPKIPTPEKGDAREKPFVTKEEIERMKADPDALIAKSKERLKSWLNAKEAEKLDTAIEDLNEAMKPDSSWAVHARIQNEYNQNTLLIAGAIRNVEDNAALAENVLHPMKSLTKLQSYLSEKARKAAEDKAKVYGSDGRRIAVIDSDKVYEWVLDYFYKDDEAEEAERKKIEKEKKIHKKTGKSASVSTKKEGAQVSLFDLI